MDAWRVVRVCANFNNVLATAVSIVQCTGAVPANQPVSGGEATDRRKSFRRKMAACPS